MTAASGCRRSEGDKRPPDEIPEDERDYYLERKYPSFGNLCPRDISSRAAKEVCDEGRGVGRPGSRRLSRLRRCHQARWARTRSANATATSSTCTSGSPAKTRTRSRCASTRPCTTPWADSGWTTTCMSTHPRPVRARRGELLRSRREPSRRERAHAGTGGRLLHHPVHDRRLPRQREAQEGVDGPCRSSRRRSATSPTRPTKLLVDQGKRTVDSFHRELGKIMWEDCGMARNASRAQAGARTDPGAARRVLAQR